jgi:cytochrome c biogenesis protein CcdA
MEDGSRADGHGPGASRGGSGPTARPHESRTFVLIRSVLGSLRAMAQDESVLLWSELRESAKSYVAGAAALLVGLIAAGAMVNFLGLAALAGLLAAEVPLWAAALICAAGLALIMIGAALLGLASIRDADPVPRRTISNIRRDFHAIREALRQEGDRHAP